MKTIGRKLKAIYLMAVIALVSICMSFIPFMANTVKADDATATAGLRVTGAQVKVIDGATQEEGNSQFAVYFHTEITEDFYNALVGESKQFGMIVGPQAMMSGFSTLPSTAPVADFDEAVGAVVTAQEIEAGKAANFRFVGTDLQEDVVFEEGIYTFEAGVIFDEADLLASGIENALKLAAATKLTAVPYYVVDGNVTINKLDAKTRVAKDILIEEATRVMFECSDSDFDMATIGYLGQKYVGNIDATGEYYMEATTGTVYKANANKELVEYMGNDLGDAEDIAIAGIPAEEIGGEISAIIDNLADGEGFSMAYSYADGTTKVLPIRVVTKVLSTIEDFFKDANGDGTVTSDEMIRLNYIFNLHATAPQGYAAPTVAIKGYYALANNIDLNNNTNLANRGYNADGSNGSGESHLQIFNDSLDVGFRATLDGRGFALQNGSPSVSSAGMFGAFYGATVKNIAFDGFTNYASNTNGQLLGYVYKSTFENVYIRAKASNNGNGPNWRALVIDDRHGASSFNNVVFESTDGLAAGKTAHQQRFTLVTSDAASLGAGKFTNTAIVGMPVTYSYAKHAEDTASYVLTLVLPEAAMAKLEVSAGEYAVSVLPEAVTNAYGNLITNVASKINATVGYVNFTEDPLAGRDYYLDSTALAASESATVYTETGFWKVVDDSLVWASLQPKEHTYSAVVKAPTCTEDGYTTYTCTCGCGDSYISSFVARRHTYSEVVTAPTCTEQGFTTYTCIHGDHEYVGNRVDPQGHTPDAAGELCIVCGEYAGEGQIYDAGEFVIDKATGKVLKANENNELVVYDATSYLGEETVVTIGGIEQTIANTAEFAVATAGLTNLTDGAKVAIVAGQNALVAQVVTKVLSTIEDFFVDADGSGAVESAEMIRLNYIFNLHASASSGAAIPTIAIKGYYVLANNIDLTSKAGELANRGYTAEGGNGSGEHHVQIWSTSSDVGFRGTLDGRGFALQNGNPYVSSAGMFGAFYGATVKNIAFVGFRNTAGNSNGQLLGYVYKSTFENVYISTIGHNNGNGPNWRAFVVDNRHGGSSFTNVVFENMDGLAEGKTGHQQRFTLVTSDAASLGTGTFKNTAVVGMPVAYSYAKHSSDTASYVMTLVLPKAAMTDFGVEAKEYAISELPEAVTNAYGNLIANVGTKLGATVGYVTFAEDPMNRDYYLDSASLASSQASSIYTETGFWKVVEGKLVWASL